MLAKAHNVEVEPRAAAGHGTPRMKWGPESDQPLRAGSDALLGVPAALLGFID